MLLARAPPPRALALVPALVPGRVLSNKQGLAVSPVPGCQFVERNWFCSILASSSPLKDVQVWRFHSGRMGRWAGSDHRKGRGCARTHVLTSEGCAPCQMMLGTLPLPLFRLLFFRDRLGVAMSTKRSSGQPYCSSASMHSWLDACRA